MSYGGFSGGDHFVVYDASGRVMFRRALFGFIRAGVSPPAARTPHAMLACACGRCRAQIPVPASPCRGARRQAASSFSLSDRRVLVDANGSPCAALKRAHMSLKPTWGVYRDAGFAAQVATVKVNYSMTPCEQRSTAFEHYCIPPACTLPASRAAPAGWPLPLSV